MHITPARNHNLYLAPLTVDNGKEICIWRYEAPYDIYNWDTWETMFDAAYEFADPVIRKEQYYGVFAHSGEWASANRLLGFAQLFPMAGITRLGLGLRPDLCGLGIGAAFVKAIVEAAIVQAPANQVDLEVLVWNTRAYKAYEQAGFVYEQTYERMTPAGKAAFHVMVYKPQ
ncbi:MAG TPA: GNAT family N-acetyltransferase [Bacilli bacterium]